jgi:hypothetical protein
VRRAPPSSLHRRLLAATEQPKAGGQKASAAAKPGAQAADREGPARGSYAAALLAAFEPGAAEAAHAAARRLKSTLMELNRQLAADFLAGAVELMAQVAAEQAEEAGGKG